MYFQKKKGEDQLEAESYKSTRPQKIYDKKTNFKHNDNVNVFCLH